MVKDISSQDFDSILRMSEKPVVVDFMAEWCPYCKKLKPVIEEIAGERAGEIDVYYVNTDEREDLTDRYDIMTVPSVFVFRGGEVAGSIVNPGTKEAVLSLVYAK